MIFVRPFFVAVRYFLVESPTSAIIIKHLLAQHTVVTGFEGLK